MNNEQPTINSALILDLIKEELLERGEQSIN